MTPACSLFKYNATFLLPPHVTSCFFLSLSESSQSEKEALTTSKVEDNYAPPVCCANKTCAKDAPYAVDSNSPPLYDTPKFPQLPGISQACQYKMNSLDGECDTNEWSIPLEESKDCYRSPQKSLADTLDLCDSHSMSSTYSSVSQLTRSRAMGHHSWDYEDFETLQSLLASPASSVGPSDRHSRLLELACHGFSPRRSSRAGSCSSYSSRYVAHSCCSVPPLGCIGHGQHCCHENRYCCYHSNQWRGISSCCSCTSSTPPRYPSRRMRPSSAPTNRFCPRSPRHCSDHTANCGNTCPQPSGIRSASCRRHTLTGTGQAHVFYRRNTILGDTSPLPVPPPPPSPTISASAAATTTTGDGMAQRRRCSDTGTGDAASVDLANSQPVRQLLNSLGLQVSEAFRCTLDSCPALKQRVPRSFALNL